MSSANLFRGLLSCWSGWSGCCCYCCCCWTSAVISNCSQKSSERHRKDVRAHSKDLDIGWAGGQEMGNRLARCSRGSSATLAQKRSVISFVCFFFFQLASLFVAHPSSSSSSFFSGLASSFSRSQIVYSVSCLLILL